MLLNEIFEKMTNAPLHEATNPQVISMFVTDAFPKDKMPTWGTTQLKITKRPDGWALVNYSTPLLYRANGKDDLLFNTQKYSASTTAIQNLIRKEIEAMGNTVKEVDEEELRKASGITEAKKPAADKRMLKNSAGEDVPFGDLLGSVRSWKVFDGNDIMDVKSALKVVRDGGDDENAMAWVNDNATTGADEIFAEFDIVDGFEEEHNELQMAISDAAKYNYDSIMPTVFFTDPVEESYEPAFAADGTEDIDAFKKVARAGGFSDADAESVYNNADGGPGGVGIIANLADAMTEGAELVGTPILYIRDPMNGSGAYKLGSGTRKFPVMTAAKLADLVDDGPYSLGAVFGTGDWAY